MESKSRRCVCRARWTLLGFRGALSGLGPGYAPAPTSGTNLCRIVCGTRALLPTPLIHLPEPLYPSLNTNYAGPWDVNQANYIVDLLIFPAYYHAQPVFGFFNTARGILFDNSRQALYVFTISSSPSFCRTSTSIS